VKTASISTLAGLLVSLALFWLMQFMISNNQQGFKKTDNIHMTEFVRLKRDTQLQTKDRNIPNEPPPPEKRPPPPKMEMEQVSMAQSDAPQIDMPNLDIPLQTDRFSGALVGGIQVGTGGISTNVIPLVRIPPRYPMRAASRRLEGWVKVEFTIREDGSVKEPIVVDAQPKNIFDRAALNAIKRWKFKPKIMGGEAFEQRAVQILQFKLSKK
jgi:protein TonB